MTEEKFNQIKELKNKIEGKEDKLRDIDLLIQTPKLVCKIYGSPNRSLRQDPEFYFFEEDEIIRLLKLGREKINSELSELKKTFSEL